MSVEVSYSFWPQYGRWTITIQSKRSGRPETESEATYVLPESVVRGLHQSYMKERARRRARAGAEP